MKKYKKGFGLLSVLILLVIFSFLSINIVQNHNFSSNIDKLKYLHLQANIHMSNIKKYIAEHSSAEIELYQLNDDRFNLILEKEDIGSSIKYHLYLKTIDDTHISIYTTILK
ncbi:MAG: hypothetical protein KAJ49_01125 [Arcobacteraceae bacterium]|nr:hypothetical protein [Arcobacteraceae bacterium]